MQLAISRLLREVTPISSDPLDQLSRAERFIEAYLTFTKGQSAGKPFKLEIWQRALIRRIYNDLDEDGFRRIRTFYTSVPRKNGKTELAAAIGLFHLLSEGEKGADIVCAAKSRDQAKLVFNAARIMVEQSPELRSRVRIFKTALEYKGNVLRTLSYDSQIAMGLNPSLVLCDELHVWEGESGRDFFETLVSAQGARRQPLIFIITTAGVSKYSVCYEQRISGISGTCHVR
jgi:phage terminase large subunit-like protein